MLSIKKTKWPRLKLLLLTIFLGSHAFSKGSTKKIPNIEITDYKYFRKITYDGNQILLFRDLKNRNINYVSDTDQITLIKVKNFEQSTYKTSLNGKNFQLDFVQNKIRLNVRDKSIFYMDKSDQKNLCEQQRQSYLAQLSDINFKIDEIKIEKLLDGDTCNGIPKDIMLRNLQRTLGEKANTMNICMEKDSLKNLFYADINFQRYIGAAYSKYLKIIDQISEEKNPLKIKCSTADKSKLGSFDESTNPMTISVNYQLLKKMYNDEAALGKAIKNTLHHEFFHVVQQESSNIKDPNCIDEAYAKLFTNLCDDNIVVEKIPSSAEIREKCAANEKISFNFIHSINHDAKPELLTVGETHKTATTENQNHAYNNQENLKIINPSDWARVDSLPTLLSDIKPNVRNGIPYTVSTKSDFGKKATATFEVFKKSSEGLTAKLKRIIAGTTDPALPNSTGPSKLNIGTTSTPRENLPTSLPTSTTSSVQVKMTGDKSSASNTTAGLNNETTDAVSPNTNSRMPAGESATSSQKTVGGKGQPSEMAGGRTSGPSARNSPSIQSSNTGRTANNAPNQSTNPQSLAYLSTPVSTQVQTQQEGTAVFAAIKSLKAFDSMTGSQYKEVRKLYYNPFFINLLETNGILIKIKNGKESKIIGAELNKKTKKVFIDEEQELKATTKVKK